MLVTVFVVDDVLVIVILDVEVEVEVVVAVVVEVIVLVEVEVEVAVVVEVAVLVRVTVSKTVVVETLVVVVEGAVVDSANSTVTSVVSPLPASTAEILYVPYGIFAVAVAGQTNTLLALKAPSPSVEA